VNNYKNILCVTDFSSNSQIAAERACEIAKQYSANLSLLHVIEYFPEDRSNVQIAPENADPKTYRKDQAQASLSELATKMDYKELSQEILFSPHSAKHEILHFAQERNIGLIVVASHGHHGITSLLGSTANKIVHSASCDVLVVRARA